MTGLWRITGSDSATLNKKGRQAQTGALDHMFVNSAALDWGVKAWTNTSAWISDQLPICASWAIQRNPTLSWTWPGTMECDAKPRRIPWVGTQSTYTQWADYAVGWLANSYGVTPKKKTVITTRITSDKRTKVDVTYTRFLAAQKRLSYLASSGATIPDSKLGRQFRALMLWIPQDLALARDVLDGALLSYLTHCQEEAIRK